MSPTMSPNTLIIGGSGKVARHLTHLLATSAQPHTVHSIIRSASQTASLKALGANPIVQSIETSSPSDLAATITSTKSTSIVWCAGAGGGDPARTKAVDHEGAVKAMDAAVLAGVKRFVLVSAVDVRDRAAKAPEWYGEGDFAVSDRMWKAIGPYMEAKLAADRELVKGNGRRGLDYTIVRPGRLSDEPGKGTVSAGKVSLQGAIAREDVARVVVECLKQDGTAGLAFDLNGGDVGVEEAVAGVVKGRVDAFEGRY